MSTNKEENLSEIAKEMLRDLVANEKVFALKTKRLKAFFKKSNERLNKLFLQLEEAVKARDERKNKLN